MFRPAATATYCFPSYAKVIGEACELIISDGRLMAARADCGRTLARSHSHFDTLLVGAEVGVLVNKTSETMAAVRIVISSMACKRAAANLYHKPLQTREPPDR